MHFREKLHKMFTTTESGTNFNFIEVRTTRLLLCLHMLLESMKEKKVTSRAWIQVHMIILMQSHNQYYFMLMLVLIAHPSDQL